MESSNVNKFVAEFLRLRKIDFWQALETDCAIETHLEAENAAKNFPSVEEIRNWRRMFMSVYLMGFARQRRKS